MTTAPTTTGEVRGTQEGALLRFAGIPFAAPPVGDLRWRPPQPAEPWEGVRDASAFGPIAPQSADMLTAFIGMEQEPTDEDCLFLNVWTPALDDARRPVMVWIHGGAFIIGSGSNPLYSSGALAERGEVVLVTVNYRLGALGFLELGWIDDDLAGSGNLGLLDQVAALEWVRDNIAAFGGDPDNVTIFGESAGGMSVASLLAAEAAAGLFHKAIAQSGATQAAATSAQAEESARRYVEAVGATTVDELRATPVERLVEVQSHLVVASLTDVGAMLERGVAGGLPFRPVEDGRVLPTSALTAIRDGSAAGVPLITGTTRDEWKLFGLLDFEPLDADGLRIRLDHLTGDGEKALAAYADRVGELDPKAAFSVIATDLFFRYPAVELGEAQLEQTADVWEYVFSWATPAMAGLLGSCHALELPFVFGLAGDPRLVGFLGDAAPVDLAEAMQGAWLSFARTGDPGPDWPRYDLDRRTVRVFDDPTGLVEDPDASAREFCSTVDHR
jgi:para-nitrobenzyl esterase